MYTELAEATAMTEIMAGHLNCSGRKKMIVDAYENNSKAFCHAASTEENAPRLSASTSYRHWSVVIFGYVLELNLPLEQ